MFLIDEWDKNQYTGNKMGDFKKAHKTYVFNGGYKCETTKTTQHFFFSWAPVGPCADVVLDRFRMLNIWGVSHPQSTCSPVGGGSCSILFFGWRGLKSSSSCRAVPSSLHACCFFPRSNGVHFKDRWGEGDRKWPRNIGVLAICVLSLAVSEHPSRHTPGLGLVWTCPIWG